ncbi:TerC family protein [Membranicola marinus]|uniref:TerC family protein n=1 Tax=Membranihabitans marinus TaxID=1227546 RepID=A0A953HQQ2_9BACT|nr:TerC family protein [Membranihabitans marinus]MBY5956650.1 TerC family protein [Membranihabitans marinus]
MIELLFGIAIPDFSHPAIWMSLLTLTFLEIVLGVDNILFISIISGKLPKEHQGKAINIGLILAMVMRIVLLFGISYLTAMQAVWFSFDIGWLAAGVSGQSVILFAGGVFLLYKATSEIHHKLEGDQLAAANKKVNTLSNAIVQISVINLVFSIDSILTAVGMTSGLDGALLIMIIAVVISVGIMMAFAVPVGNFVNEHPTIQMLGLAFLILIGFMLVTEAAHLSHLEVFDETVGAIPKGYLYFAIAFSLMVEMLNMRLRKTKKPVQLHGAAEKVSESN